MATRAPATERRLASAALVLCAHGIRGGVGTAAENAARIAARARFAEVHACALKGRPRLIDVKVPEIVLAPLLMAEGYTLRAMLAQIEHTMPRAARDTVLQPVGIHPRLSYMLQS